MEGRIVPFRSSTVRLRVAGQLAWSLLAALIPAAGARAEPGIAPGSAAVIAAGQPVLVRVSPGWDAAVSYELANGSPVTVWDAEQTALDGSLWYPIDGGFVPADAVTSVAADSTTSAPPADAAAPANSPKDLTTGNDAVSDPSSVEPDAGLQKDAAQDTGVTPVTETAPVDSTAPVTTEPM